MADQLFLLPDGWPRLLLLYVALIPFLLMFLRRGSTDTAIPLPAGHVNPALLKARPARRPQRSLVIVARDERHQLDDLFDHLRALLDHEGEQLEILLVDDRSVDGTREAMEAFAAKSYLVRLLWFPDAKGKPDCLRRTVPECRGAQILFSDADCRMRPGWSRSLGEALDTGWDLVGGPVLLDPADTGFRWQRANWLLLSGLGLRATQAGRPLSLWGGNLAFNRQAVEDAGGYEALVRGHHNEDLELARSMCHAECKVGMFAPDEDWIVRTAATADDKLPGQIARWLSGWKVLPLLARLGLLLVLCWFPALILLGIMKPALFLLVTTAMLFSLHALLVHMAERLDEVPPTLGDGIHYLLGWPPLLLLVLLATVKQAGSWRSWGGSS